MLFVKKKKLLFLLYMLFVSGVALGQDEDTRVNSLLGEWLLKNYEVVDGSGKLSANDLENIRTDVGNDLVVNVMKFKFGKGELPATDQRRNKTFKNKQVVFRKGNVTLLR